MSTRVLLKTLAAPAILASLPFFSPPLLAVTYPALPTATVNVTCCPAVTRTVAVHTAADLQAAFDNAAFGDEIVLDAGGTYEGNFILRVPSGTSGWVTVRSSASASLPPPGTRVSLADASNMAKIMSPNPGDPGDKTGPAIGNNYNSTTYTDMGIHHYRFIGIEFATGNTSFNWHVMLFAPAARGVPFNQATMPHDIIIDRSLIHGNDPLGVFPDGAAALNGSAVFDVQNGAIVDSKIYNLWGIGIETQAITCGGGPGPRLIQNNEISGGTEGFMCGGGLLAYSDVITTDVTVVHNYFTRPIAWQTSTVVPYVKNNFELKVGQRFRITDNVFENNWDRGGAQFGYSLTLTPRPYQDSGYGSVPAIFTTNVVSDILVANNVVRQVGGFVSTSLYDYACTAAAVTCAQSARLLIANNMANYDTKYFAAPTGGISASAMQDFSIKRNTLLGTNAGGGTAAAAFYGNRSSCSDTFGTTFEWSNNINLNGTHGDCAFDPGNILVTSWAGTGSVTSNLIANVTGSELTAWTAFGHSSQIAATLSSLMLSSDQLTLQPSSPYSGAGIGANLSCFNEAAVRAGTPSPLCPLPPEVQSGTSPTLTITTPTTASSYTASTGTVSVGGTASSSTGITQVTWTTDRGGSGTAQGTSSWTISGLTLAAGTTTVTVTAHDAASNVASASIVITYNSSDAIPPSISISAPTSNTSYTSTSSIINLSGSASDNVGVTLVTWATSAGGSGTASGTTSWAINGLVVPSGTTTITVTAHDAAGNVASAALTVTYSAPDTTPPTIAMTTPTSTGTFVTSSNMIVLGGTASDNVGVTQVNWVTDRGGSGIAAGTTSWLTSQIPLASGLTHVTVSAHDAAGNVANSVLAVTYNPPDTTPPTISITSPTSAATFSTSNTSITLAGTSSDNVGVQQVAWVTNHGASGLASGTTAWTINGLVLPAGSTIITVTAGDAAGNAASAVLTVTSTPSDTTPPAISIIAPTTAGTYTTSSSAIALGGTASDNVGVTQVTWVTDSGASGIASGTTAWTIPSITLVSGQNTISVTARDAAGNQTTAAVVVACNPTNSTISITSPTSSSTFQTSQSTITLGGTGTGSITQVIWASDKGAQGSATGTTAWTASAIPLQSGSNRITVTGRDAAGNQSSAAITIKYSHPSVSTSVPPGKAGKLYSYQLSVVDGIPPYTWSAGTLPNGLQLSGSGTILGTPNTTGTFAMNVSVVDSIGAATSVVINFQVDSWLSLVSGASLAPGQVAPESMVTAFGAQLSPVTQTTTESPLPLELGGATVRIRDVNGVDRPAKLFYVSPGQINFVVPAETALGPAVASVYNGNELIVTSGLYIAERAPALFFMNPDGLAAAGLVRVRGNTSTYEPAVQLDPATNQFVAVPIDLGPDTDQVYLTLYGTGFRRRSDLYSVHLFIGELLVPVNYAGPSGTFDGLDIVNALLPQELRGQGMVGISLMVNGITANTVRVQIK